MEVRLIQEQNINPALERSISVLMEQLNPDLRSRRLAEIISESEDLYICGVWNGPELLGMASLAIYEVLSGKKGLIEDVVVDQKHRRKGVARILMEKLIQLAQEQGLDQLILFTGFHRKPAQQLYEHCGFTRKDSYQYIFNL